MRRRKHRKATKLDDSLELLLDTMCNSFGGIMFIAIALVIISVLIPKPESEETVKKPEKKPKQVKNLVAENSEIDRQIAEEMEKIAELEQKLTRQNQLWLEPSTKEWAKFHENKQKIAGKQKIWLIMKESGFWLLNRKNQPLFDNNQQWILSDGVIGNYSDENQTLSINMLENGKIDQKSLKNHLSQFNTEKFYIEARIEENSENFIKWRKLRNELVEDFTINWLPEVDLKELKILVKKVKNEQK